MALGLHGFTTLVAKESTRRAHTHNLHHSKMTGGSIKRPRCRFGNIFNIFFWMFSNFLPPSELTKSGSTWSQDEPFGLHASLTCRPRYAIQPQASHMIAYPCNLLFLEEMNMFLVDTQFKCILRLITASLGAFFLIRTCPSFAKIWFRDSPSFFKPSVGSCSFPFVGPRLQIAASSRVVVNALIKMFSVQCQKQWESLFVGKSETYRATPREKFVYNLYCESQLGSWLLVIREQSENRGCGGR